MNSIIQAQGLHHITLNGADKNTSINFIKFIFILYYIMEKIYIYFINDETIENVKGKTPLKAAKKLWRKYKFDNKFFLVDKESKEKYDFDPKDWSRKGKFLQ